MIRAAMIWLLLIGLAQAQPTNWEEFKVRGKISGAHCDFSQLPGPRIFRAWAKAQYARPGWTEIGFWPITHGRREKGLTVVGPSLARIPLRGIGLFGSGCILQVEPTIVLPAVQTGAPILLPIPLHTIPPGTTLRLQLVEMLSFEWAVSDIATITWPFP